MRGDVASGNQAFMTDQTVDSKTPWGTAPPEPQPPTTSPRIADAPETLLFEFVDRPGLLKIAIVNFLLGIVTLGFYRFWGKTRVRQHIWSSVHINNEPLEYTGTGMELFKGFLVVLGCIFLPLAIISAAIGILAGPESPLIFVFQFIVILLVQVFWGYALYKARKFQLSRTLWRGIRGTLVGSAMTYSLTYFGSILAKGMSLGWATPVMNTVLQEQIISDMRFGDAAFKFRGKAGPLYPTYALCWFLTLGAMIVIPALFGAGFLGISMTDLEKIAEPGSSDNASFEYIFLWVIGLFAVFFVLTSLLIPMLWAVYSAKELRTFANYTRFDGAQFRLDATAGSLIWLAIVNILIIILTLGIGTPFAQRRLVRYVVDRISLDGAIDIDRVRQSQVKLETRGEGLADAFDIGGI
jgi:uncharacterized membrane protein YjgN (DUF898 family)